MNLLFFTLSQELFLTNGMIGQLGEEMNNRLFFHLAQL